MAQRLVARALPELRLVHKPYSWHRLGIRVVSQAARLHTTPRDILNTKKPPAVRRYRVGYPQQDKLKTPINFKLVDDPNAWFLSSKDDSPSDEDITLFHPENQQTVVLNRQALRDACECDKCVDPHSGQKNFGTTDIPDELPIQSYQRLEDASLQVIWEKDFLSSGEPHNSVYPAKTIKSWFSKSREGFPSPPNLALWDKSIFEASPSTVKYDDWVAGGPGFHAAVAQLWNFGLLFIDGVPKSEDSVVTVASQIGHIMETFYGRTWDVRSKLKAENIAYTNTFLGLHQDLLYTQCPPRIQLLHCLENTCEGGDSIFSDSQRAAKLMQLGPPALFKALVNRRIRYHYRKDGHFYERMLRVLQDNGDAVFWSPPFQCPEQPSRWSTSGSKHYAIWMKAAKIFRRLLEDEQWLYEYKLKPGQCVIFDNLRVLHGRRKFDTSSGSRWLKGAYISRDEWMSKTLTLAEEITAATKNRVPSKLNQAQKLSDWHNVWPSDAETGS
ncbi:TfdA family Taurine catabolism dioxygenase TauD [Seiridium cupressi]